MKDRNWKQRKRFPGFSDSEAIYLCSVFFFMFYDEYGDDFDVFCGCFGIFESIRVVFRGKIIYYIADLPVTRLRLLTNKSDNIAARSTAALIHRLARFKLISPLAYFIARSSSFAFFDSLLRNSWDARLTSRITDTQSQKNRRLF